MKSRSFRQWLVVGALTLGATIVQFASVNPATAGIPEGRVTVSFGDLDLGKQAGVAQLYKRIRNAAIAACGAEEITATRLLSAEQQNCVDDAVATGVAHVNNERLSALVASQD